MICPDCHGTCKKLVEAQDEHGRRGWNKADCDCNGGYVGLPNPELLIGFQLPVGPDQE